MYKKILVTGGAGFIGTNLIKKLLHNGYVVTSIDNYSTGLKSNHQPGCEYIEYDITESSNLEQFGEFDIVYHMAAIARIQPSFQDPLRYFKYNALGTFNISEYCSRNKIPMVFAGSSSHHSGKFSNPYTFSKDISEEIIELYQRNFELKASITRFYNVYGPYHLRKGGYCTLIGAWETMRLSNEPLKIYGDGTKKRDFTHVNDIINALLLIKEKDAWGYIFELGRGNNYSVKQIADMFGGLIEYGENKPGEAQETLCKDSTANIVLNWTPTHNIEDYIKEFRNENNL
jgi:UDP-glucose 4-epimerase